MKGLQKFSSLTTTRETIEINFSRVRVDEEEFAGEQQES